MKEQISAHKKIVSSYSFVFSLIWRVFKGWKDTHSLHFPKAPVFRGKGAGETQACRALAEGEHFPRLRGGTKVFLDTREQMEPNATASRTETHCCLSQLANRLRLRKQWRDLHGGNFHFNITETHFLTERWPFPESRLPTPPPNRGQMRTHSPWQRGPGVWCFQDFLTPSLGRKTYVSNRTLSLLDVCTSTSFSYKQGGSLYTLNLND